MTDELKQMNLKLINKFLEGTRTDNTESSYKSDLINFSDSIDKSLLEVDIDDVNHYFNKVLKFKPNNDENKEKEKYKPRSKNRKLISLNKFYKYLIKKKLISDNPFEDFNKFKVDDTKEVVLLEKKQVDALIKYIKMKIKKAKTEYQQKNLEIRNLAIINTLIKTGMRIDEALSLNFNELDLAKGTITLVGENTKGKTSRILYMNEETIKILQNYLDIRSCFDKKNSNLVFISNEGNKIGENVINKMLKKYGKAEGVAVEGLHSHCFRHFFATLLYNKYKDINLVRLALGHVSIATTMTYIHSDDDVERMKYL